MPSLEEQAAVIESQVMTWVEKDQVAIDVSNTDKGRWNCARLAVRLNDELDGELSKQAVWMAVAGIYDRTDTTVRRMEYVARDIAPQMVAAYPLLTFGLWKVARDAKHIDDKPAAILEVVGWIQDHYDRFGKTPSHRTVEGWVYGDSDRARAVWRSRTEGVVDQLEKIRHDQYCPPAFRSLMGWVQVVVSNYLETGVVGVLTAPLPDENPSQERRRVQE